MSTDQHQLQHRRLQEERAEADTNAQRLPADQLARWSACRSAHRFMAFYNKQLVAYKLNLHRPEVIDIFTCKGLDVSLASGLSSYWEGQNSATRFWVSSTPKEVAPGCFLWMLKYSSVEFMTYKGSKSLHFSVGYRTEVAPTALVEGKTFLLEKGTFDNFRFEETRHA